MLKELRKYDNLGTPKFFWEFIQLIKKGDIWKLTDIKTHFYNKIIDDRQIFDGCLPILEISGIISINEETEEVVLKYGFRNIHSEKMCQAKLIEAFLINLKDDENFQHIIKQSHFDYLHHKAILVEGSAFGLQYANFKRLLLDFNFLEPHPQFKNKYIVSSKWKSFFDYEITPKIRQLMSLEILKEKIKKQEVNGEIAEKYVLEFEKIRLDAKDGVQWIAPYDVSVGFDILSFHTKEDSAANRFIEVKSYSGETPYFYWSKNEIKIAEIKKGDYFVYLVNRDKISHASYIPTIISDPIRNILEDDNWDKIVDKYYLRKMDI